MCNSAFGWNLPFQYMSSDNRKNDSLEAFEFWWDSPVYASMSSFRFDERSKRVSRVSLTSLLGLRDKELPVPGEVADSDGHAEKTECMAEGAEGALHSCGRESHI